MSDHERNEDVAPQAPAQYCPNCGARAGAGDHFCRRCGTALDEVPDEAGGAAEAEPPTQEATTTTAATTPEESGEKRSRKRTALVITGLLALALGAAAAVVLASGVVDFADDDSGLSPRVERAFRREMQKRDEFFKHERAYLSALGAARRELRRYRRQDRSFKAESKRIDEEFADEFDACTRNLATPCPEPDYPEPPKVPSFGSETKEIRAAAAALEELRAELSGLTVAAELAGLHRQLLAATEALKVEVEHNADVFDEAVEEPEGEAPGRLNKGKIRTLREDSALPAIRQMNRAAVRTIRRLGRPLGDYDVPGGRDLDPKDHSDAA